MYPLPLLALFSVLFLTCSGTRPDDRRHEQPTLGYRSASLLEVDGLRFKDLNGNDSLEPYEDWRLSPEARSRDLTGRMQMEEKAGFMLISTTRLENDPGFGPPTGRPITSGFNEEDQVSEVNIFTRKPLDYPMMSAAGTTRAVTEYHERHFILRANTSPRILAEWANNLQALCESHGHGIPAIVASNPRNHITVDASVGLSLGKTPFSTWPGELGLAATRDTTLVREFADIARQEWLATGIRKGYMYMADLATEPRWQRVEGTFGEDAQLAADMIRQIVLGFQGTQLGPQSIALTTKHFPGGGAVEGGQDPHFDWGKREVFTGGMFENNLIPFRAAIDAGTSAIMPYYSYPVNTEYPEVAYAYNKPVLQGVLRERLGFDGIINSDTGPIDMMPWGVEDRTIPERYKMAIEAGVNLFSGTADPTLLIRTLRMYPALQPLVDDSVYRLLLEKFRLGLFENPYVDPEGAAALVGREDFQARADVAMRKSIVLLRNGVSEEEKVLPLRPAQKIYFATYLSRRDDDPITTYLPDVHPYGVRFVDTPEEADRIVLWVIPRGKSLFEADGSPLHLNLSANGVEVDRLRQLIGTKPTVLLVNYTNPWAIDELYTPGPGNIPAVLATFGTTPEAVMDVLTGRFTPVGKMPFSTPASDAAAQQQVSDLPGYQEAKGYALFWFNEGMDGY
ncbi:glycoside hydrolase family 3 protein [Neolewinella litorea]|uniref:beta-glucosidase n=1 Tax=Neolewinella litorea TaxID=2562452 RepID=A0A4S4NAP1_9BACT|nr:glycoside hydrolase family 3 N-terminal domain-containing protein [Neolewinella litorea]THH36414.1 glycoside hydrolase family 3 protein [Neolewinella litorea]